MNTQKQLDEVRSIGDVNAQNFAKQIYDGVVSAGGRITPQLEIHRQLNALSFEEGWNSAIDAIQKKIAE